MISLVCKMCGSNDLVLEGDMYVCKYCSTRYPANMIHKLVVDVNGPVEIVTGNAEKERLYHNINTYIRLRDFSNADKIADECIRRFPDDWRSWWHKFKLPFETYFADGWGTHSPDMGLIDKIIILCRDDTRSAFAEIGSFFRKVFEKHGNRPTSGSRDINEIYIDLISGSKINANALSWISYWLLTDGITLFEKIKDPVLLRLTNELRLNYIFEVNSGRFAPKREEYGLFLIGSQYYDDIDRDRLTLQNLLSKYKYKIEKRKYPLSKDRFLACTKNDTFLLQPRVAFVSDNWITVFGEASEGKRAYHFYYQNAKYIFNR